MELTNKERELIERLRRIKKTGWEHKVVLQYLPIGETHIQQILIPKPVPIQGVRAAMLNVMHDLNVQGVDSSLFLVGFDGGVGSVFQVAG